MRKWRQLNITGNKHPVTGKPEASPSNPCSKANIELHSLSSQYSEGWGRRIALSWVQTGIHSTRAARDTKRDARPYLNLTTITHTKRKGGKNSDLYSANTYSTSADQKHWEYPLSRFLPQSSAWKTWALTHSTFWACQSIYHCLESRSRTRNSYFGSFNNKG